MTTNTSADSGDRFRYIRAPRADSAHDMVLPSAGISNRRCVSVPEPSSGAWTRPSTEYIRGSSAAACSVTMDMNNPQSSESGVPPIISHQRSQNHTGPLQGHQSTSPVLPPPQNYYRTPHQGAPGTHARTEGVASALTDPSPFPASVLPPVTQHGSLVGHQHAPSNAHPHLHLVHSPQFAFPRHMSSAGQEENMHHISPPMLTALRPYAPVYQYQMLPDHVPNPSYIFPPSSSAPTSPIYPQNTSPPPHSPSSLRHAVNDSSSSAHRSTPYAAHGAYTPIGYTTPPSYAYPSPTSFVPALSIYGSHFPPPHYARVYGFPTGQESQEMRWYSPPGVTATSNSFEGTQRELQPGLTAGYPPAGQLEGKRRGRQNSVSFPSSEPQPTRRQINHTRVGRPLNDAKQETTQALSIEIPPVGKDKHQERRSYHPNPPAHRSDWVMWAGNVPSEVTHDEVREFFNQPLPPLSPKQTESSKDRQQVYGGVSTVFLITRSNCAFVNFDSEAQLEAATARFNGQPIRPDNQRCPHLVCRVRRREDDLMAGVGGQRGNAMHIKWVKEQKAKVPREQADTVGSPKAIARLSSPLSLSSDDGAGEGHVHTHSNLSRSASIASTNSDILTRYFPQRYFILKSLTQYDLDLSIQRNVWTTQRHNEEILDQAYRTSKDVFLIFSVNKSGEFYGYARMAGPVLQGESGVPWASATGSTAPPSSVSSLSEISAVSRDDTGAKRQKPLYILPPREDSVVKRSPQSAPVGQPSFGSAEPLKPYHKLTNSMPNPSTSLPVVSFQTSSERGFDTLSRAQARGTREPAEHVSREPVSEKMPFEGRSTMDGTEPAGSQPFRIEWIRTDTLPFFRTRHLRNPWNHGREVKVSRDGTELEPTVGQQLLDDWDMLSAAVDNSSGPSRTTERRRGSKSTQHKP